MGKEDNNKMGSYKSHLIIRHFGAIKEVDITTNKVNVIIGKQSSGKSTIAKVLSFCQWAEKRFIIEGKFNYKIGDRLQNFHRIGDEYFSPSTYIEYHSEVVRITFDHRKEIKIEVNDRTKYRKSKNIYIPAERNFATTIPNLGRYNETNDNIMSLLYDWNDAKAEYVKAKDLLNLGLSFSYNEKKEEDYIHFTSEAGKRKKMPLRFASSGLQSITPLIILFDYLTDLLYTKERPLSPYEKQLIDKQLNELRALGFEPIERKIAEYHFSRFIIEEPEQNVYPQTQKELIYYLLKVLVNSEREHQLTLTTHSPFILYSLNNCMIGGLVKNKMPESEQKEMNSRESWIDPELVSVWQLENGELTSIKDDDTKVIGTHSFNNIMNNVMGEYFEMLGYLGK